MQMEIMQENIERKNGNSGPIYVIFSSSPHRKSFRASAQNSAAKGAQQAQKQTLKYTKSYSSSFFRYGYIFL